MVWWLRLSRAGRGGSTCRRSRPDVPPDEIGELRRTVQQIERGEVAAAADIVAAALARAEQDPGVAADRGLARLHVEMFGVKSDFTADGDAALIGAQIEGRGGEAERCGRSSSSRRAWV